MNEEFNIGMEGRLALRPGEALQVCGLLNPSTLDPEAAAAALIQRSGYPFPLARLGSRRVVLISTILAVLGAAQPAPAPPAAVQVLPVRRGGPRLAPGKGVSA